MLVLPEKRLSGICTAVSERFHFFWRRRRKKVYGVEIVPEAIEMRKKCENHGIEKCRIFVGKAEEVLPEKYEKRHPGEHADDDCSRSARKGCEENRAPHHGRYAAGSVETVVLLSQQKPDDTIEIDLDLDELDATSAELKATYQEIKDYVLKEFGLKVSNLYISQVKRKCGIEVGENYNLPKSENARVPQCPKEKEEAIKAALKYFAMI